MGQYEFKMPDIGEGLVEGEIVNLEGAKNNLAFTLKTK